MEQSEYQKKHEEARQWFKSAKFGLMIHWGLYCLPAGEWKGRRMPYIGEWAQSYFRIPNDEYHQLTNVFNPMLFNADEWVQIARDAGMNYIVITSKHHEGFAMYHSRNSKFNIVDATPFKRDVIGELAEACRNHGLKLGLYYSQEIDWSEPNGGGYMRGHTWGNGTASWTNDWDFPDNEHKNYTQCFESKIVPQVQEILTNYGDLCLIWFDTPHSISPEQSRQLADMVHQYQPGCLVNSRIGNNMGDYRSMGDNEIPNDMKEGGLFESACTLNDTWGYKSFDNNWKSPERVIEIKRHLNSRNLNYLLNVGPDYLGRIPAPAVDILRKVGEAES